MCLLNRKVERESKKMCYTCEEDLFGAGEEDHPVEADGGAEVDIILPRPTMPECERIQNTHREYTLEGLLMTILMASDFSTPYSHAIEDVRIVLPVKVGVSGLMCHLNSLTALYRIINVVTTP